MNYGGEAGRKPPSYPRGKRAGAKASPLILVVKYKLRKFFIYILYFIAYLHRAFRSRNVSTGWFMD